MLLLFKLLPIRVALCGAVGGSLLPDALLAALSGVDRTLTGIALLLRHVSMPGCNGAHATPLTGSAAAVAVAGTWQHPRAPHWWHKLLIVEPALPK
jgi:hypothetical protein